MSRVDFPNRLNKVRRQLNHILNDHRYYQNDSTREFTISMYTAFGKRKITKKMEIAMDRIISNYIKWQNDNSTVGIFELPDSTSNLGNEMGANTGMRAWACFSYRTTQ